MNKRVHHSADEIEQDIRATESEIARTLDLLQEKLSPGAIIDTLWKSSRDNGAEFAANFGRSIRDNPLPITLIGTGLAWLMLSRRGNGHHRHEAVEYSASPEPHEEWTREEDASRFSHAGVYPTTAGESEGYGMSESYAAGSPGEDVAGTATTPTEPGAFGAEGRVESEVREEPISPESGAAAAARQAEDRARAAAHAAQERARDLADRAGASSARDARSAAEEAYSSARSAAGEAYSGAKSAAEGAYSGARSAAGEAYSGAKSAAEGAYSGARSAAEGAYSGARRAAGEAYSGAKSTAYKAYSGARGGAEHAAERLQAGGEAAYRRSSEMAHRATSRATEAASVIGSSLREHPIIAGAVLAGIGALVGALLPPTRREDALMGERSDSAKAMAADAAEREAKRAREVARAAAEAARREAEARGLTPGSIADRAEEEIRRVADAGKEIARAAMREGEAAARKDSSGDEEKWGEQSQSGEEPGARDPYLDAQAAPPPRPVIEPVGTEPQPPAPAETTDPLKKED